MGWGVVHWGGLAILGPRVMGGAPRLGVSSSQAPSGREKRQLVTLIRATIYLTHPVEARHDATR